VGLTFSFPLRLKFISCESKADIEHMKGFKKLISVLSLVGKIGLNERKTEAERKM